MSINIGDKPEMNVVNVGDELTTDQLAALQNAQGASATNPVLTRTNTFNTADTAVRITQEGAGAAFVVEDSANPDSTPFKIENDGRVSILGNTVAGYGLTVNGDISVSQIAATNIYGRLISCTTTLPSQIAGTFTNTSGSTADAVRITNLGTGNSFVVEDDTNPDATPFVINSIGSVGIGTTTPTSKLHVNGSANITSSSSIAPILQVTQSGVAAVATFVNTATATADAVRITNLGSGNSFVVEDDTNPDATPFVIDAAGKVAIGASSAGASALLVSSTAGKASFNGGAAVSGNLECATILVSSRIDISTSTTTNPALLISQSGTTDAVRITNLGTGNSFVVEDDTNPDSSPFVINADGNVGIGTTTPSTKLAVIGSASFTGATSVSTSGSNAFTVSVTNTSTGVIGSLIDYRGTGNAFRIVDNTTERFNIAGSGAVTLTNYLTLHTGALATAVGSQTYPDELEFKVGTTTYRVPARAI